MTWHALVRVRFLCFSKLLSVLIFVQVALGLICLYNSVPLSFICILANTNQLLCFEVYWWFTSCGKLSVFTSVYSSHDCRHFLIWQLLQSVFSSTGKNSSTQQWSCFIIGMYQVIDLLTSNDFAIFLIFQFSIVDGLLWYIGMPKIEASATLKISSGLLIFLLVNVLIKGTTAQQPVLFSHCLVFKYFVQITNLKF